MLVAPIIALLGGCHTPDKANIELRRQNQALRDELEQLKRERQGHEATVRAFESKATTVPVLPADRVGELFTVHGIQFGRLTGGADLDPSKPGEDGLKIYVVPRDGSGQPLKAAGSFVVEAFDLATPAGSDNRIGRWEFGIDQAAKNWFGQAMLYTYVLPCPWQNVMPRSADLTIKVSFTDGLTRRTFTEQKQVKITPPATTAPTAPATAASRS